MACYNPDGDVHMCVHYSVFWVRRWKGKAIPVQTLRVSRGWAYQISREAAQHVVRLSALRTGRLTHKEIFLVLLSARGWFVLRTTVWPEALCQWKVPVTPSGIEPATARLVAQFLSQLRNRVPPPSLPFPCAPYTKSHTKWKVIHSSRTESNESGGLNHGTWARETGHGCLAFPRREVPLFQGGQGTTLVISTSF